MQNIEIYSKKGCARCLQAENLCRIKGVAHTIKKLGKDYTHEDLLALTHGRAREMPVVVMDGTVTDFSGLMSFLKQ